MSSYPLTPNLRTPNPRTPAARSLPALIGLVAAAALLTGCTETAPAESPTPTAAAPTSSAPATGTPPTDEEIAWAGDVCTSTETLKADVQGLVTAVTAGGGDVQAALKAQLTTIKESAATLASTLDAAPGGSEDDPERAAVTDAHENFTASLDALDASVMAVEGTSGTELVDAVKAVARAAGESLVALGSTAQAITTAAADRSSTIGQAFEAAPECDALTK